MLRALLFIVPLILALTTNAAAPLYIKTFGNPASTPLIFLHGGPGYNAATFESTTPQRLADSGYFVIVYDRRGEGRSRDTGAKFSFRESTADLDQIYERFGLQKATLLGHSFGGIVAARFAEAHPEKVRALVLIGAPVTLQESFRNIIARCRSIYQATSDSANLKYLAILESMDTASLTYSTYCFGHAMQNGFYAPKNRSAEAKAINAAFRADTALSKLATQMDFRAPKGYWESEKYTTIDLGPTLKRLLAKKVAVYGIYGKEDGLYSTAQIAELQGMLGHDRVQYLDSCSHNVFIDQQTAFIAALRRWSR